MIKTGFTISTYNLLTYILFLSFDACCRFSVSGEAVSVFNRVRDVRHLSLRDLLKLFERFNAIRDTGDRRMILLYLQDVHECFLASIQSKEIRAELIVNSGYKFHINKEEVGNSF